MPAKSISFPVGVAGKCPFYRLGWGCENWSSRIFLLLGLRCQCSISPTCFSLGLKTNSPLRWGSKCFLPECAVSSGRSRPASMEQYLVWWCHEGDGWVAVLGIYCLWYPANASWIQLCTSWSDVRFGPLLMPREGDKIINCTTDKRKNQCHLAAFK